MTNPTFDMQAAIQALRDADHSSEALLALRID